MDRWWNQETTDPEADPTFLVVEAKAHEPPAWKRRILDRLSVLVSNATSDLLVLMRTGLVLAYDETDPGKIASADIAFTVTGDRVERIRALLAQPLKKNKKTGEEYKYTNAYQFIACDAMEDGSFRAVARLAHGEWKARITKKGAVQSHKVTVIQVTTGLQQLIGTYVSSTSLQALPRPLRSGVCQEVAQQVASFIGQIASTKVKGDVEFPTVEDRDPVRRRAAYETAIAALMRDVRPFAYAKVREIFPGDYAADDPRGDRLIVDDERWFAVTRTPEPHPIPLFFVQGNAIPLLEGTARFDAGVSKRNRHRGTLTADPRVLASRPVNVRAKGATHLHEWYAAIPILDTGDPEILDALASRQTADGKGRGLDLNLTPMPITHLTRWRQDEKDMLLLLSGNRDRFERVLRNPMFEIAWTRLVRKGGEWYLQVTVRVRVPEHAMPMRVMGVSFGIDAIATWVVVDEAGETAEFGALAPNGQIIAFLAEKRSLEWDQQKQRWVGGATFGKSLESIAHGVVNTLVETASEHHAQLALEDVAYVQKASRDHAQNVLFTAWNYGQLRRIAAYKAPLHGMPEPIFCSDYVTAFTCPNCGAIRGKDQKPEKATTWRENGTLHCRPCGYAGPLTPHDRARRVALHALAIWRERDARKRTKE